MRYRLSTVPTATPTVLRLFNAIVLEITVLALLFSCGHGSSNLTITMQAALKQLHPPFFVFGDSLVDVGNNKFVPFSPVRVDYFPNGVDFADGPTGRFCNGRTVLDVLCDIIGVPYPQASLDPNTRILDIIHKGANFASAGAGILDHTGDNLGPHLSMNRQIEYFNATVVDLNSNLGSAQSSKFLAKAVGLTVIGSNDFINNYWLPLSLTSFTRLLYTPTQFNDLLLHYYGEQLTTLYNLGLRKIVVNGVAPLGNIPFALHEDADVVEDFTRKINAEVEQFNVKGLKYALLPQLARKLPGVILLYADIYDIFTDIRENASSYGLKVFNNSCCQGTYCAPYRPFCTDRNSYAFWDAFHPTEALNIVVANQLMSRGLMFYGTTVSLISLKQFVDLA